jgi:hypothetical protein
MINRKVKTNWLSALVKRKNYWTGALVLLVGVLLALWWLDYGYSIFYGSSFFHEHGFDQEWARGELGDFIGGGLGGIAIWFLIYTIILQITSLKTQKNDSFEAGVFRIFEALKPELQGLSARIFSKLLKKKPTLEEKSELFKEMLGKFHDKDKTVFLRAMQKDIYCNEIKLVVKELDGKKDQTKYDELERAIERFRNIMNLLKNSLDKTEIHNDGDFSAAIKATEVYQTYRKCFLEK